MLPKKTQELFLPCNIKQQYLQQSWENSCVEHHYEIVCKVLAIIYQFSHKFLYTDYEFTQNTDKPEFWFFQIIIEICLNMCLQCTTSQTYAIYKRILIHLLFSLRVSPFCLLRIPGSKIGEIFIVRITRPWHMHVLEFHRPRRWYLIDTRIRRMRTMRLILFYVTRIEFFLWTISIPFFRSTLLRYNGARQNNVICHPNLIF